MTNTSNQGQPAQLDRQNWTRRATRAGLVLLALWLLFELAAALITFASLPAGGFEPGQPSTVYAANGSPVGPLTGDVYRLPTDLKEMPAHLPQAFVAAEDIRFYQHWGVDPRGIGRALVTNLRHRGIAEGGSTITQQVVKNTLLHPRQTLHRKIQEALLALLFEQRYEKDAILSLYLNQLYMGHGTYGVGAASRLYFDKDAADLTLAQSATLAGITAAPESYSPLRKPEVATERRNEVLDRMVAAGYLEPAQAEQEKAQPLIVSQGQLDLENPYPWYMEVVRQELRSRYNLDERVAALMGLKIYTGLDPVLQQTAEAGLSARIFPASAPDGVEAAFAAVDPRTGEVRALVGGREYHVGGGLNRATDGRISPGSVLKPVIVYGPAFEYLGLTPDSLVADEPINRDGWEPQNWDHNFRGDVTIREAARLSLNIPSIKLMEQVGVERARKFATKLGIPIANEDQGLPLALGAMSQGVSPLQITAAYQPFANGGTYRQPYLITKVEGADGAIKGRRLTQRKVMRPQTAHGVTQLLQAVVEQGTGTGALLDRPMAGKTGTVELPGGQAFQGKEGNSAAWFVGYTPDLVAGIWVGYDQIDSEHYLPPEINGSTYPTWLWRQIAGAGLAGKPALAFLGADGRPPAPAVARPVTPVSPPPSEEQKPVLPAILGFSASPGPQPGSVNLTWQTEGGNLPADGLGFLVLRGSEAEIPVDEAHTLATISAAPYLDVLAQPGTYFYQVVAIDRATGELGTPSAPLQVVVTDQEENQKPPGEGRPGTEPGDSEPADPAPGEGEPPDPTDPKPGDPDPGERPPEDQPPTEPAPGDGSVGDNPPTEPAPGEPPPAKP